MDTQIDALYLQFTSAIERAKGGAYHFNFEKVLSSVLDEAKYEDLGTRMKMSNALRQRFAEDRKAA